MRSGGPAFPKKKAGLLIKGRLHFSLSMIHILSLADVRRRAETVGAADVMLSRSGWFPKLPRVHGCACQASRNRLFCKIILHVRPDESQRSPQRGHHPLSSAAKSFGVKFLPPHLGNSRVLDFPGTGTGRFGQSFPGMSPTDFRGPYAGISKEHPNIRLPLHIRVRQASHNAVT